MPILNSAFEQAKPFKIACGSYHNVCLSYKPPKQEEAQNEQDENINKIVAAAGTAPG
jgi:hypothetical protein